MTHYRVLKQHTQPELNQALGLNFALASNSATLEHLSVRRQPQKHCSRSHRSPFCCSELAAGSFRARPGPFGSGLYFRQAHPTHVKPGFHDPGHTSFSSSFQHFRRTSGCTAVDPRRPSISTERPGRLVSTSQFTVQLSGVRSRTPATIKEHIPCLLPPVAPALVPDPTS